MEQVDFQKFYRETYVRLGFNLESCDGVSENKLRYAEKKLGAEIPRALRDYYLVAGCEKSLNRAFNRLVSIDELEIHHTKLPFMGENQGAVIWGVDIHTPAVPNPPVFQGPVFKGEAKNWLPECDHCSSFLVFMLHLQAGYGRGMPLSASAPANLEIRSELDDNWYFGGEVNGMRTYSRNGQAVCFLKWPHLIKKTEGWQVFVGATNQEALKVIQRDLAINLKNQRSRPIGAK